MLLVALCSPLLHAQLLRVDINAGVGRADTTAPGFVRWDISSDLFAATLRRVATRSFTNTTLVDDITNGVTVTNVSVISCTIAQSSPDPSVVDATILLSANWQGKLGMLTSTDPNAGWRLAGDGVWVHKKDDTISVDRPYTEGGALSLTISNLSAGLHTVTTYHNDLWGTNTVWHTVTNRLSGYVVSLRGVPVLTNTASFFATNDARCGFAFVTVSNSYDGEPVVLTFDPDHTSVLDLVVLNGFEIDRSAPPGYIASGATPAQGNEHVAANNDSPTNNSAGKGFLNLNWVPSLYAVSNEVYFGTSSNAVLNATIASPEFKGRVQTNVFAVTNLDSKLTYYWRVDSVNAASGVTNISKGDLWYFRTRHEAFPGAEGYGRWARGGRGGVVMEVTNLLDYDSTLGEPIIPGSYRAAIEATGPRTIVFRVSGFIPLKRKCIINQDNGFVTIAGQTAPGDGICLGNFAAGLGSCKDVIMRHVRLRVGDFCRDSMDGIGNGNSDYSIIDHCSISWSIDEGTSSRSGHNFSFQRNIISEALNNSYHYKASDRTQTERHSFAGSISGGIGSYHHNLLAHNTGRNWSLAGGLTGTGAYDGYIDIRNNVVYNWKDRTTDGGAKNVNFIGNYYKPGPVTTLFKLMRPDCGSATDRQIYFITNNVMEGQASFYPNNWNGVQPTPATNDLTFTVAQISNAIPFFADSVTNGNVFTHSASNAYKIVLSDCGANLPRQDFIDGRAVSNTLSGSYTFSGSIDHWLGIIDSQEDVGGYPTNSYATYNVPADSDHDGLPDWWEIADGTNPNSATGDFSDSNGDLDGDGYTALEDYLNWMAVPHFDCVKNGAVDIDLSQFARGFTASPNFAVTAPTNGTVTVLGGTAHFSATNNFVGAGGFTFIVTDAQGASMTNSIGVRVQPPPAEPPVFGIRQQGENILLELTGENGRSYQIQNRDGLVAPWLEWTNIFGTGGIQLLPLPANTNQPVRFFRAVTQ